MTDSDDDGTELKINKIYADKYSTWRQKEELQKLKSRYGDEEDSDDSTSEEEDDDAEALTGQLEKDWLRTLAAVRSRDPRIYQKDVKFFQSDESEEEEESGSSEEDSEDESTPKKKKQKEKKDPMLLKDYERKFLLEKGGVASESEDEGEEEDEKQHSPGYYEEQEKLKKSLQDAIGDMDSDDDLGSYLKARHKTKAEKAQEEEEYLQWLKGEKDELETDKQVEEELAPLKSYWSRPDLDEREKYLRDFMLNKAYRSQDSDDEEYPSYDKLVADIQEDEETLQHQENFEREYNFRFEEPNANVIPRLNRVIEDSVRSKDNKRALKRQEVKERKQREKDQKQEEIRQLKNLKKKEILEKLEQLKEVTGNPSVGFSAQDIEEDFDPTAHDKMMQKYFGEDFYEEDELQKPEFADDIDDGIDADDWDAWEGPSGSTQHEQGGETTEDYDEAVRGEEGGGGGDEPFAEDANFNMDADFDPRSATYTSGKKKKKSKFKQIIEKNKPTFEEACQKYEGSDHPFGDYLDDYFKLDCEDIIGGDIKCRFRYRKTVPNDYGLTVEEILRCPDKELNSWASIKKITQFRNNDDEMFEVRKYKKAKVQRKKINVLRTLKESSEKDPDQSTPEKKKKQKKLSQAQQSSSRQQEVSNSTQTKRKRKAEPSATETQTESESSPSKKKPKVNSSGGKMSNRGDSSNLKSEAKQENSGKERKKKKKKKKKAQSADGGAKQAGGAKKTKAKRETVYDPKKNTLDERLKAFSVDPRKFKYTKHKKLNQKIG